jgi:spore germination protein GerM
VKTLLALLVALAAVQTASAAGPSSTVYFVHGERLAAAARPGATLPSALRALVAGPTARERARGLHSEIPARTTFRGVAVRNGVATVDLSRRFEAGGGSLSMTTRLKQLVWTATAFRGVTAVRLELDGRLVRSIGGEGVMVDRPLTRAALR